MKFSGKGYYQPTPRNLRKLGDSLLAASLFVGSYGAIEGNTYITIGSLIAGVVGKFLTNFFSADKKKDDKPEG
jgi:hypothetical protein